MQEKQKRAQEEAEREAERVAQRAKELEEEIRTDALRQQRAKEAESRTRKRANSDTTEVPSGWDTLTESFPHEVEIGGTRFTAVKLFSPRNGEQLAQEDSRQTLTIYRIAGNNIFGRSYL